MQAYKQKKILHITTHLGGGVGTVLLGYFSQVKNNSSFLHKVICLGYASENAINVANNIGLKLFDKMAENKRRILSLVAEADLVLIHWWNHPLLYDLLVREEFPASRVIFWSHISGYPAPNNFTDKIFRYPDKFVFTTPVSYQTKEAQALSDERKEKLSDIWSTAGVERMASIKLKEHPGFNVGYIGNLDFTKMHPDFLDICSRINIPDVKFIVVGGPNGELLQREADRCGMGEKFNFTGFVSEEEKWGYLSFFDICGYPLAPHHYATCDQALQEPMAVGVVPVVFSNPMEKIMVKNMVTGIVADNIDKYVKGIKDLYYNKDLRNLLSKNAKEYATSTFSLDKMNRKWEEVFNEVLNFPKTVKKWEINKNIKNITPADVFLEALGSYGEDFVNYCNAKNDTEKECALEKIKKLSQAAHWRSPTKSTVHQYSTFFPDDKLLSFWSKSMRAAESA